MSVYNTQRQPLDIGPAIHEGGEGWICPVLSQPTKLAKIYKPQCRAGRETKLRWLVTHAPNDPGRSIGHASIAWPELLLYDQSKSFSGYVMPRINNARTLLQIFNPRLRAQSSTACDGFFLHRAARNLAAAIGALHKSDYVIGDLNESNILVTHQALVTVIDTDSFQAREEHEGQIIFYPCPVGRPEYTPPELQGKQFRGQVRQPEQDAFALGVLIFQLLLGGNHPFRAIWRGNDAPPPVEERILLGFFPYGQATSNLPVRPPPNITLDILHPPLQNLMLRCFVDGHHNPRKRPLPEEWENVLRDAERFLQKCPKGHVYAGHLGNCPQCGRKPVPGIQTTAPSAGPVVAPSPIYPKAASPVNVSLHSRLCTTCQNAFPPTLLFCPNCGAAVDPKPCPHCGFRHVPEGAKCCPKCGKPT